MNSLIYIYVLLSNYLLVPRYTKLKIERARENIIKQSIWVSHYGTQFGI